MRLRVSALALPFLLLIPFARWAVPAWGDWIARRATVAAAVVAPPRPKAEEPAASVPSPSSVPNEADAGDQDRDNPDDAGGTSASRASASSRAKGAAPSAPAGPIAVHIPAGLVQKAIDDGDKHIRAKTARGPDKKAIGVRLSGVSGLGVGLRDGDLVVGVDGKPALDEDACTDAALAVVARGQSVLHATLMRGEQRIDCTLDLPLAPELPGKAR